MRKHFRGTRDDWVQKFSRPIKDLVQKTDYVWNRIKTKVDKPTETSIIVVRKPVLQRQTGWNEMSLSSQYLAEIDLFTCRYNFSQLCHLMQKNSLKPKNRWHKFVYFHKKPSENVILLNFRFSLTVKHIQQVWLIRTFQIRKVCYVLLLMCSYYQFLVMANMDCTR
jgi:hypothetical protein